MKAEQNTTEKDVLAPHNEHRMQCMELWCGVSETRTDVGMTGPYGYVLSRPFGKGNDGDIYYFTSCAPGRIARVLLAEVAGHGLAVSEVVELLRSIMDRTANVIGQRRLMNDASKFASKNLTDNDATAIMLQPNRSRILRKNNLMAPIRMMRGVAEIDSGNESE